MNDAENRQERYVVRGRFWHITVKHKSTAIALFVAIPVATLVLPLLTLWWFLGS